MARLSERDYQGALLVLREAGAVDGPIPFPVPVLESLRRLVPSDVVTYHQRTGGHPAVVSAGEPRAPMTAEIRAACLRYWHQDQLTPWNGARKVSDLLSRRAFQRTDLYQQVSRLVGIEHMMRLWLVPADGARLEFDNARRDFSERDRNVLEVLVPHLTQLYWRSANARRAPPQLATTAAKLTPRELEVLELVGEGRLNSEIATLLWVSPHTVRKHLENIFDKLGVHSRTAAVAAIAPHRVPSSKDSPARSSSSLPPGAASRRNASVSRR